MPQRLTMALALVLAISCGGDRKANEPATTAPLEVHPPTAKVAPKGSQQFSLVPSTVQVGWSVAETGGGSITPAGMYTAPGLSGVFHVVATSTSNPAVSAQAVVTVESGVAISAVSPVNGVACVPVQLSATVTGTSDTQVLWRRPVHAGRSPPPASSPRHEGPGHASSRRRRTPTLPSLLQSRSTSRPSAC